MQISILAILAFLLLVVAVIWIRRSQLKNQTIAAFRQLAEELELNNLTIETLEDTPQIELRPFRRMRKTPVFGYLYGRREQESIHVFNCRNVTYVFTQTSEDNFPEFYALQEKMGDKLSEMFRELDFELKEFPEFSSQFVLRSDNPDKLKSLFSKDIIAFFRKNKGVNLSAKGNKVLVHFTKKITTSSSEEIRKLLQASIEFRRLARQNQGVLNPF